MPCKIPETLLFGVPDARHVGSGHVPQRWATGGRTPRGFRQSQLIRILMFILLVSCIAHHFPDPCYDFKDWFMRGFCFKLTFFVTVHGQGIDSPTLPESWETTSRAETHTSNPKVQQSKMYFDPCLALEYINSGKEPPRQFQGTVCAGFATRQGPQLRQSCRLASFGYS